MHQHTKQSNWQFYLLTEIEDLKRKIEEYVQDSKFKEKSLMQLQHQIEIITQERINRQRHFHVKISHLINQSVETFLMHSPIKTFWIQSTQIHILYGNVFDVLCSELTLNNERDRLQSQITKAHLEQKTLTTSNEVLETTLQKKDQHLSDLNQRLQESASK